MEADDCRKLSHWSLTASYVIVLLGLFCTQDPPPTIFFLIPGRDTLLSQSVAAQRRKQLFIRGSQVLFGVAPTGRVMPLTVVFACLLVCLGFSRVVARNFFFFFFCHSPFFVFFCGCKSVVDPPHSPPPTPHLSSLLRGVCQSNAHPPSPFIQLFPSFQRRAGRKRPMIPRNVPVSPGHFFLLDARILGPNAKRFAISSGTIAMWTLLFSFTIFFSCIVPSP